MAEQLQHSASEVTAEADLRPPKRQVRPPKRQVRPMIVTVIALIWTLGALAAAILLLLQRPEEADAIASLPVTTVAAAVVVAGLGLLVGWGLWTLKNWARTAMIGILALAGLYYGTLVVFDAFAQIFGGEQVVPLLEILRISGLGLLRILAGGAIPLALIYGLIRTESTFRETTQEREVVDRAVWYVLIAAALSAIIIVLLIILFTGKEAWQSIREVGILEMVFGTVWRPGSIIGGEGAQFGMLPMIAGAILSTFGAMLLGLPLSLGAAILLTEVAPAWVRELFQPAIELLAGIPSVVYGLFGMVVLAPIIRKIPVPGNTGFGLLNASVILAIMILPTVTNIARDAIRAVPKAYKEGSLALGTTHWQTIRQVMLPAARSGIVAAVILGIGRALGETMALIMVIGNSIAMPKPLNDNPLTLFLSTARTLTGNIAVEINYAAGAHRSALFFSGVLLFFMILAVNSLARYLMRERLAS
jgi:phosphate transport system permease protein